MKYLSKFPTQSFVLLIGGGAVAALIFVLVMLMGWEKVTVERQFSREARANKLLGFAEYLGAHEINFERRTRLAAAIDQYSSRNTAIYYTRTAGVPSEIESHRMMSWLRSGGTLLYEPVRFTDDSGSRANDPILDQLEISFRREPSSLTQGGLWGSGYEAGCSATSDALLDVELEDGRASVNLISRGWFESTSRTSGLIPQRYLIRKVDNGRVVIFTDSHLFENNHFLCYDNARFVTSLVGLPLDSDQRTNIENFIWVEHAKSQGLLALLWELFPVEMVLLGLVSLCWLWTRLVRDHPGKDVVEDGHRSIRDFLHSSGFFLWRQGRGTSLTQELQNRILARFKENSPAEITGKVANNTGLSQSDIQFALFDDIQRQTKRVFIVRMRLLKEILDMQ